MSAIKRVKKNIRSAGMDNITAIGVVDPASVIGPAAPYL